jgi:hypothetical protein
MDPRIIRNCWRKSGILPPEWSANFANEDQKEKSRLIKESEDLALLISKLQLGSDEMPFEEYVEWKVKTSLRLNIACQSWLIWHGLRPENKTS